MTVRRAGARRPDRIALPERYEILGHVADGGMASVWRALDRVLHRIVAIKLLAASYACDEAAVRRFQREARAGARVSAHPHIVSIYDTGVTPQHGGGGTPFIVMEHLPGGTVAGALEHRPVGPRLALEWVRDAAAALDHAHAHGVVHRDVKPANLLLDDARRLRVADFGIARVASEATITNTGLVLGTAAYMAPELAEGHPATAASDRYSLAVTAYELLVGARPFDGDAWLARGERAAERPPSASFANPALPPAVDPVLMRGMARSPGHRPSTAAELASALETALEAPRRAPVFLSAPARRGARPVPALALASIAAASLAIGIATGAPSDSTTVGSTAGPGHRDALSRAMTAARAESHRRGGAAPPARRNEAPARPAAVDPPAAPTGNPIPAADPPAAPPGKPIPPGKHLGWFKHGFKHDGPGPGGRRDGHRLLEGPRGDGRNG
jgi:serine/threonine-protein kinase